jgi:outer membrane lipoprotein-sorting protein
MLGSIEAEFRLLKLEDVKTAGKRIRCAVISVTPNDKTLGWKQRLWIDPETAFVWKSVMQLPPGRDEISELMATEETVIWDEVQIGPISDEAFAFTPPPGFRVLEIVPNLYWSVPP